MVGGGAARPKEKKKRGQQSERGIVSEEIRAKCRKTRSGGKRHKIHKGLDTNKEGGTLADRGDVRKRRGSTGKSKKMQVSREGWG